MEKIIFSRDNALEALKIAKEHDNDWLYDNYPKPDGERRPSRTGFLMFEGREYAIKSLGRFANELAGAPMIDNPTTQKFARHFAGLGFQLVDSLDNESERSAERQRRLAEVWLTPRQAKFRKMVFRDMGAQCVVSGCSTLTSIEAAHILPVFLGGCDKSWNGLPLRADIHRLFDAGELQISSKTWKVAMAPSVRGDYSAYDGVTLQDHMVRSSNFAKAKDALKKRNDAMKTGANQLKSIAIPLYSQSS